MNLGISQGNKRVDQLKIMVFFLRKLLCHRVVVPSDSLPGNCGHVNTFLKTTGAFCCVTVSSDVLCLYFQRKSTSGEIFGSPYHFLSF